MSEEIYIPNAWRCPKCSFFLTKNIFYAQSGNVGPDTSEHDEKCPNDGCSMERMTWKHNAMQLFDEVTRLRAALELATDELKAIANQKPREQPSSDWYDGSNYNDAEMLGEDRVRWSLADGAESALAKIREARGEAR